MGFPGHSDGEESACNVEDLGSTPGLGTSPGEGIGYPLQYSWASLVVQMVKSLPAVWEAWVRPLGWEDPLEKGKVIHSSILTWRISMDKGAWWATVHRVEKSRTWLTKHSTAQQTQVEEHLPLGKHHFPKPRFWKQITCVWTLALSLSMCTTLGK